MKHGRLENFSESDMRAATITRNAYADQLVEKWSRTDVGAGLADLYVRDARRARRTAWAIEMQEKHLQRLSENIISNDFQTTPENVLKIVRIGTANSNRGNIFTEYPLSTDDDAIYFLEYIRSNALRGATAGESIASQVRPYFSGEAQLEPIGTGNSVTTVFTDTLPVQPVKRYSLKLIVNGALQGTDDGAGVISSTLLTAGTVNYTTGAVSLTFAVAPVTGVAIEIEFHWDSEVTANYTQYGKVSIQITKKRFHARPMPLEYEYTRMAQAVYESHGFGSLEDMLITAIGDEHAKRRDFKAVQLAKRVALQNPVTTFNADFAAEGEISDKSHAQRILSTIDGVSGTIYNELQRGRINRLVCGSGALTYLKKHNLWKTDMSQPRVGGTYFAGYLDDLEVYACVANVSEGLVANNEIVATYQNPESEGEVNIAFGVLTEFADKLVHPQHRVEGVLSTVEDAMVIQPKFVRMIRIDNLVL